MKTLLNIANVYLKRIHRQLVISNTLRIVELKRDDLTDEQYDKIINYELDLLRKEMRI